MICATSLHLLIMFIFQGLSSQFQQMGLHGTTGAPRPVVRPAANFSAERDSDIIRKAMKGAGKNNRHIT